jgi:hypothetical protein
MRLGALLVLVTGCDQAFDLVKVDGTTAGDAAGPDTAVCRDPSKLTHDEDKDGIVDGCDVCPNVSDPGQADGDVDTVGDACDPNPSSPGDRLAFFDAFDDPTLDSRWLSYGTKSQWKLADDAVSQLYAGTTNDVSTLVLHQTFRSPVALGVMSGQILLEPSSSSSMGIYTRLLPADETAYPPALFCFSFLFAAGAPNPRAIVIEREPDQQLKASKLFDGPDPFLLQARTTGACAVRPEGGANVTVMVSLPELDSEVALSVRNTTGTFHSIAIYEVAP